MIPSSTASLNTIISMQTAQKIQFEIIRQQVFDQFIENTQYEVMKTKTKDYLLLYDGSLIVYDKANPKPTDVLIDFNTLKDEDRRILLNILYYQYVQHLDRFCSLSNNLITDSVPDANVPFDLMLPGITLIELDGTVNVIEQIVSEEQKGNKDNTTLELYTRLSSLPNIYIPSLNLLIDQIRYDSHIENNNTADYRNFYKYNEYITNMIIGNTKYNQDDLMDNQTTINDILLIQRTGIQKTHYDTYEIDPINQPDKLITIIQGVISNCYLYIDLDQLEELSFQKITSDTDKELIRINLINYWSCPSAIYESNAIETSDWYMGGFSNTQNCQNLVDAILNAQTQFDLQDGTTKQIRDKNDYKDEQVQIILWDLIYNIDIVKGMALPITDQQKSDVIRDIINNLHINIIIPTIVDQNEMITFCKYILNRYKYNSQIMRYYIAFFMLNFVDCLDPNFTIDDNQVFTASEVMQLQQWIINNLPDQIQPRYPWFALSKETTDRAFSIKWMFETRSYITNKIQNYNNLTQILIQNPQIVQNSINDILSFIQNGVKNTIKCLKENKGKPVDFYAKYDYNTDGTNYVLHQNYKQCDQSLTIRLYNSQKAQFEYLTLYNLPSLYLDYDFANIQQIQDSVKQYFRINEYPVCQQYIQFNTPDIKPIYDYIAYDNYQIDYNNIQPYNNDILDIHAGIKKPDTHEMFLILIQDITRLEQLDSQSITYQIPGPILNPDEKNQISAVKQIYQFVKSHVDQQITNNYKLFTDVLKYFEHQYRYQRVFNLSIPRAFLTSSSEYIIIKAVYLLNEYVLKLKQGISTIPDQDELKSIIQLLQYFVPVLQEKYKILKYQTLIFLRDQLESSQIILSKYLNKQINYNKQLQITPQTINRQSLQSGNIQNTYNISIYQESYMYYKSTIICYIKIKAQDIQTYRSIIEQQPISSYCDENDLKKLNTIESFISEEIITNSITIMQLSQIMMYSQMGKLFILVFNQGDENQQNWETTGENIVLNIKDTIYKHPLFYIIDQQIYIKLDWIVALFQLGTLIYNVTNYFPDSQYSYIQHAGIIQATQCIKYLSNINIIKLQDILIQMNLQKLSEYIQPLLERLSKKQNQYRQFNLYYALNHYMNESVTSPDVQKYVEESKINIFPNKLNKLTSTQEYILSDFITNPTINNLFQLANDYENKHRFIYQNVVKAIWSSILYKDVLTVLSCVISIFWNKQYDSELQQIVDAENHVDTKFCYSSRKIHLPLYIAKFKELLPSIDIQKQDDIQDNEAKLREFIEWGTNMQEKEVEQNTELIYDHLTK